MKTTKEERVRWLEWTKGSAKWFREEIEPENVADLLEDLDTLEAELTMARESRDTWKATAQLATKVGDITVQNSNDAGKVTALFDEIADLRAQNKAMTEVLADLRKLNERAHR